MRAQTPIFVLSSGRAGSTLLARMIHAHPELLCVSDLFEPVGEEPYFDRQTRLGGAEFFRILSRPSYPQRIAYWRQQPTDELLFMPEDDEMVSLLLTYTLPFLQPDDPMALYREVEAAVSAFPEDKMANQLERFCGWLRDRFGRRLWVERTGGSLSHTRRIVATWPQARYVHNFRDPRETAISMLHGSFFRLYLELTKGLGLAEWDWRRSPPVSELGEMLNRWVVDAVAVLDELPAEQHLDLSFEGLLDRPEQTLRELAQFLLRRPPSAADRAWARQQAALVRPVPRRFPTLELAERRQLEESCRESLVALGYR